jgi:hypothetical protein
MPGHSRRKTPSGELLFVPAYDIAVIYAGRGRTPSALEWLEKAYEENSGFMPYVNLDPRFLPLRRV